MQWYFRALTCMGMFSMLSSAFVTLRLFKNMSPTTMVTSMALVSFFMTGLSYMLRQKRVVEWILNHKYLVIKTEIFLGLTIAIGMVVLGIDNTTLVVRWILAQTVMEALNSMFKFLFEKIKEERGDGAYIAATKDMYSTFGFMCGHLLAVAVINLYPDVNQDWLIYSHGFIMSLGSIGLFVCLKEHDRHMAVK